MLIKVLSGGRIEPGCRSPFAIELRIFSAIISAAFRGRSDGGGAESRLARVAPRAARFFRSFNDLSFYYGALQIEMIVGRHASLCEDR